MFVHVLSFCISMRQIKVYRQIIEDPSVSLNLRQNLFYSIDRWFSYSKLDSVEANDVGIVDQLSKAAPEA